MVFKVSMFQRASAFASSSFVRFNSTTSAAPPVPKNSSFSKYLFGAAAAAGLGAAIYYRPGCPAADPKAKRLSANPQIPALKDDVFQAFTLKEIIPINHNTKTFRFALPENATQLGLPITSFLLTKFQKGTKPDGKPDMVIRPYTPVEEPGADYFDLIVKVYPSGNMSSHIHNMNVGDSLEMKGPIKKFEYKANEFQHVGCIAGGSGLTPMLQIMHAIDRNPADKTKVSFIFANITEQDIILREQLDKLVNKHKDQFKVHYVLDNPPAGWTGGAGFVNQQMLNELMPKPGQGKVFVCGPPPMVNHISGSKAPDFSQGAIGGLLKKMGYTENDVFKF